MRLNCPICGSRDCREFTYLGSAKLLDRPDDGKGAEAFHRYLNLRDNPAGLNAELWQHTDGCRAWLLAERDTVSHEFHSVKIAARIKRGAS